MKSKLLSPDAALNENDSKWVKIVKKYWSSVLSILISIFAGFVVGLSTRTLQESHVYSSIFVVESVLCLLISFIVRKERYRNVFRRFVFYFLIVGVATLLSSKYSFMLS